MRVIFMGTPEIAAKALESIAKEHIVEAVFTQPDKPNLRGNKIKYSPVKEYALANNIKTFQPKTVRDDETLRQIKELNADIIVIVAYGKIIPKSLIEIPKHKIINLHASLLPKYRGASPIHSAIINGDKITGVSVMYINENLDEGDVILEKEVTILENDTVQELYDKIVINGCAALSEALKEIESGTDKPVRQNHAEATFCKPIEKNECCINWEKTNDEIYNFVRGLNPFPVAFTVNEEKRIKIYSVEKIEKKYSGEAGDIVELIKDKGPVVKTGNGAVIITGAKPENRNIINGKDLINGKYFMLGTKNILQK